MESEKLSDSCGHITGLLHFPSPLYAPSARLSGNTSVFYGPHLGIARELAGPAESRPHPDLLNLTLYLTGPGSGLRSSVNHRRGSATHALQLLSLQGAAL